MQADGIDLIKKICFEIFEQLAFMFGEELDKDEVESPQGDFIRAVMTFSGHRKGSIELVIPKRLAPALANNILGIDESSHPDAEIAEDALKELLNTVCGRILPTIFTDTETFDLHPPEVAGITKFQWQDLLNQEQTIVFSIEESPVLLRIHFVK